MQCKLVPRSNLFFNLFFLLKVEIYKINSILFLILFYKLNDKIYYNEEYNNFIECLFI